MSEIILHHYPQSPVAEKVRVILGIKNAAWHSVIIPRIPPKPLYFPLTGGYRRTPALQIGADIYCDSRRIITVLEEHIPEPTVAPDGSQGLLWGLSQWTDGLFFESALRVVLTVTHDAMGDDFAKDRGLLYFGDGDAISKFKDNFAANLAQLRGQISWFDLQLSSERDFVLGDTPGISDALCYYLIWLLKERWEDSNEFFSEFPYLNRWYDRVKAIGHGLPREMTAEQALDVARNAEPVATQKEDPRDPLGLRPGDGISIVHCGTGGDTPVEGRLIASSPDTITLGITNPDLGDLALHFPRVGYDIRRL